MIIASSLFGADPTCAMVVTVDCRGTRHFVITVSHTIDGQLEQRFATSASAAFRVAAEIGEALYEDVIEEAGSDLAELI